MSDSDRRQFLGLGAAAAAAGLTTGCATGGGDALVPDLIVVNGNVYTIDDAQPRAQAFAVNHGRFAAEMRRAAACRPGGCVLRWQRLFF